MIVIKPELNRYDFDTFPPMFNTFYLPKNALLFRGYDSTFPVISDRPAYFTTKRRVANAYKRNNNHKVSAFKTNKILKLYDLRYIKQLLLQIFGQIQSNDPNLMTFCKILTISYGLTSCKRQLEILKENFGGKISNNIYTSIENYINQIEDNRKRNIIEYASHPLEAQGIRMGETTTDSISVLFLRDLFGQQIDGYIAPNFKSPFHVEQGGIIPAEIVLFNPKISQIEVINTKDYSINEMLFDGTFHFKVNESMEAYSYDTEISHKTKDINIHIDKGTGLKETRIRMRGGSNKIFDKGGDNYNKIQTFVRDTITKIYGEEYYKELDKYVLSKTKRAEKAEIDRKSIHKFAGGGVGIRIETTDEMREAFRKAFGPKKD